MNPYPRRPRYGMLGVRYTVHVYCLTTKIRCCTESNAVRAPAITSRTTPSVASGPMNTRHATRDADVTTRTSWSVAATHLSVRWIRSATTGTASTRTTTRSGWPSDRAISPSKVSIPIRGECTRLLETTRCEAQVPLARPPVATSQGKRSLHSVPSDSPVDYKAYSVKWSGGMDHSVPIRHAVGEPLDGVAVTFVVGPVEEYHSADTVRPSPCFVESHIHQVVHPVQRPQPALLWSEPDVSRSNLGAHHGRIRLLRERYPDRFLACERVDRSLYRDHRLMPQGAKPGCLWPVHLRSHPKENVRCTGTNGTLPLPLTLMICVLTAMNEDTGSALCFS